MLWSSFIDDESGPPADVFEAFVNSLGLQWIQD